MYSSARTYQNNGGVNQYLMKEILEASPEQLLMKVYDYAIVNAQKKDMAKTNSALQELINALRYDGGEEVKEFSLGLLKLYNFCKEQTRKGNFEVVHEILTELRNSWLQIFKKK